MIQGQGHDTDTDKDRETDTDRDLDKDRNIDTAMDMNAAKIYADGSYTPWKFVQTGIRPC
jgi:hypothetical protein